MLVYQRVTDITDKTDITDITDIAIYEYKPLA